MPDFLLERLNEISAEEAYEKVKAIYLEEPHEEMGIEYSYDDTITKSSSDYVSIKKSKIIAFENNKMDVTREFEVMEDYLYDDITCPNERRELIIYYANRMCVNHSIWKILPYFARDYFFKEKKRTLEEINKDIKDTGGCFQFWRLHKDKCAKLKDMHYGYYLNIMLLSLLSDLYDKIEKYKCPWKGPGYESRGLISIMFDKIDEELMKKITWDTSSIKKKREFLRHKRLLQRQEISFDSLSKFNKPYFKRSANAGAKAAASLFMYWHEKKYITGLMMEKNGYPTENVKIIIDTFDMNENRKLTARGLKNAFAKIENGDDGKMFIFRNLLDKK